MFLMDYFLSVFYMSVVLTGCVALLLTLASAEFVAPRLGRVEEGGSRSGQSW